MTDKEKYEALVAEIEHQKEETSIGLNEWENGEEHGRMDVINALQKKIKSMQGEPTNDDLEGEINRYLSTWSTSKDNGIVFCEKMARHFAAWQKEQMMKDAVDGWAEEPECFLWRVISDDLTGEFVVKNKLQDGDKVKLIVIKEE